MIKRFNKKGFTLVEIIVVLVILAILAAIAVPSVMKNIFKKHIQFTLLFRLKKQNLQMK